MDANFLRLGFSCITVCGYYVFQGNCTYGWFYPGRRMTLKKCHLFFYGETNIPLKINIDSKQPTCMYQLGFSRGPHNIVLGLSVVKLV